MQDSQPLKEQVVVVTGGGRGIGRALSLKFASLGATVMVNYSRREDAAAAVVNEILANGGNAKALGFDVADAEAVESAFNEIFEEYKRIDVLVNNAGIAIDALAMRLRKEDWQRQLDVNLSGSFFCAQAALKYMMKARYGRIINISSVIGEMGNAGQVAYSASKAGVIGMTKSLAKELAVRGVTVNAITPGFIATDMTSNLNEEYKAKLLSQIPLGRLGEVDDLVDAVTFFALPGSSYITGQVLGVNGGLYM